MLKIIVGWSFFIITCFKPVQILKYLLVLCPVILLDSCSSAPRYVVKKNTPLEKKITPHSKPAPKKESPPLLVESKDETVTVIPEETDTFIEKDPADTPVVRNSAVEGIATYYANKFHGRRTASGELYNKKLFTAAHRTLPFNTLVKITNPANGKTIVVKINDRGPHNKNRLIDISRAAAEELDIIIVGVAKVVIEIVEHND
jgi:rare lipoprotein A